MVASSSSCSSGRSIAGQRGCLEAAAASRQLEGAGWVVGIRPAGVNLSSHTGKEEHAERSGSTGRTGVVLPLQAAAEAADPAARGPWQRHADPRRCQTGREPTWPKYAPEMVIRMFRCARRGSRAPPAASDPSAARCAAQWRSSCRYRAHVPAWQRGQAPGGSPDGFASRHMPPRVDCITGKPVAACAADRRHNTGLQCKPV